MSTPAPPRLKIPNGYQLTVKMNQGGQEACVVAGFIKSTGGWTAAQGQALLDAYWLVWRDIIVTSVTCTGGTLRSVNAAEDTLLELAAPPSPAGANPGESTVAAAAYLVKWGTAQAGRSGQGRTYFPGVPEGAVGADGRTVQPSFVTAIGTIVNSYLSPSWGGGVAQPAVLSFTKGAAYPINKGALAPKVALQSRRMR